MCTIFAYRPVGEGRPDPAGERARGAGGLIRIKAGPWVRCYAATMESVMTSSAPSIPLPRWRELVWPKEHGSWSLALEPLAFGLLAAPSLGGAALAIGAVAAFFVRRPLRIALTDPRGERRAASRRAAVACGALALVGWFGALVAGGAGWWPWLLPSAVAGACFLFFDLQKAGREQHAEIAGAVTFAWIPAVLAALAGWPMASATALAVVMLARAVPTVLTVRATVRARKTGAVAPIFPVALALGAAVVVAMLAHAGLAPWTAAGLGALLAGRSIALLVFPRPALRASTIGMAEAGIGVVFVVATALAWRG